MNPDEKIVRDLLEQAGIQVNGSNPWDIRVHNERLYRRVLADSTLGLGESYMEEWWDCEAIDQFVDRIFSARLGDQFRKSFQLAYRAMLARLFNRQSSGRAYQVGERHYDLGNELYRAMLDKRLNYTCAYWKDAASLDEAQEAKLELVCRKIGARDRVCASWSWAAAGAALLNMPLKSTVSLCWGLPFRRSR